MYRTCSSPTIVRIFRRSRGNKLVLHIDWTDHDLDYIRASRMQEVLARVCIQQYLKHSLENTCWGSRACLLGYISIQWCNNTIIELAVGTTQDTILLLVGLTGGRFPEVPTIQRSGLHTCRKVFLDAGYIFYFVGGVSSAAEG